MKNKSLSIAIPTYNRACVLEKHLPDLIRKVKPHNIAIYISDNASTDNTQHVINEAKKEYSFIYSNRNETNIGADRNFEKVLKMPETEYTWLLGDDDLIDDGGIEKVLEIINSNIYYDLIVVNGSNYNKTELHKPHLKTNKYEQHDRLFEDLWYMMTWISALILSKELLQKADFRKYYDTNFIHAGAIFDYLASKEYISVFWEQKPISITPKADEVVNHYSDKHISYFAKSITDTIFLLPNKYPQKLKLKVLKSSPFLSFFTLAALRVKNCFHYKDVKKYKKYLQYAAPAPFSLIVILSITPITLLKLLHKPTKFLYVIYKKYIS
jgi:glycosyltransferase involved in cell wall biosynthesis